MTLSESLSVCFKKAFITTGRACRSEFWWTALVYWLLVIGYATFYIMFIATKNPIMLLPELPIFGAMIVLYPMMYAVTIRRLQDTGHSGWTQFISLVPVAGWIALLVYLVQRGYPGPNEYGDDPLSGTDYNNLK